MANNRKTKGTGGTQATRPPAKSPEGFIPPHGGYKKLFSYQKSEIVYDGTVYFCDRFFPNPRDRTRDQMIQAARSGKQNIVEASLASGFSKESEMKLTGVARASLEELLEDYRDFMRNKNIAEWQPNHPYARRLSELCRKRNPTYDDFKRGIENPDPAICCNILLGLIKLTTFLLDRQIEKLEQDFLKNGGLRERMTRARLQARAQQQSPPS